MRIYKRLFAFGVTALGLMTFSVLAADTEADLKLREELRQKIAELDASRSAKTTPSAPVVKAHSNVDKEVDRKLREALPQKTAKLNASQSTEATPSAPVVKAHPKMAPVVVVETSVMPAAAMDDDAQTARLRAALRQRMSELSAEQATAAAPPSAPTKVKPEKVKPAARVPVPVPVPVPVAAPVVPPPTKEQRLATLLQQYKADQISPLEYHTERAKLMAE